MPLSAERLRELLHYDPDTGVFTWRVDKKGGVRAGDVAGCVMKSGYVSIRVDGVLYLAHRLAWLYAKGVWPINKIDHRSRVRSENRLANLREASDVVNGQNTTPRTEFPGTFLLAGGSRKLRRPWAARIMADHVRHELGYFATQEEAHEAYLAAKRRLHEGCTI